MCAPVFIIHDTRMPARVRTPGHLQATVSIRVSVLGLSLCLTVHPLHTRNMAPQGLCKNHRWHPEHLVWSGGSCVHVPNSVPFVSDTDLPVSPRPLILWVLTPPPLYRTWLALLVKNKHGLGTMV